MKYKVEMQQVITFIVEADSEEQFIDWAACVTPTEAREMIENNCKDLLTEDYYDTVLETVPDDTEVAINIKGEIEMSRIDEIKAYAQRRNESEMKKVVAENEKRVQLKRQITSLAPRINKLIETANCCLDNGIEIDAYHKRFSRYYDKREEGTFTTNSISHKVGFVIKRKPLLKVYEMGINAGGACGQWNFRTDGYDVYERHEDENTTREATIYWMQRFTNEFDEFEDDFYGYIDKITKTKEEMKND